MAINQKSENVPDVLLLFFSMNICLVTQLEVNLAFVLFQTTKGASAFKICRGVEAVGGSLRSVTTNPQIPLSTSVPQPP